MAAGQTHLFDLPERVFENVNLGLVADTIHHHLSCRVRVGGSSLSEHKEKENIILLIDSSKIRSQTSNQLPGNVMLVVAVDLRRENFPKDWLLTSSLTTVSPNVFMLEERF